jgi:Protein of unknown function (DUF1353)
MKPFFLNDLELVPNDDGTSWTVMDDLVYHSSTKTIIVDKGFVTDLASIPRIAWDIYPPTSIPKPSVLHDWLYSRQVVTRKQADDYLLEAMIATGVGMFKRQVIYRNVRAFGWVAWNQHTKENAAKNTNVSK